ncbi:MULTISPECIES: hypothetical protein [unclassified Psychrobacter]|uniref:hypothetical protein n=1 Tax=unclassified Psychrobacter TaxID=196806 RepID=UPI00078C0937|nr:MULTISPECIES: hypothetical protein [unclassified Psychrobacter]AMN49542.1 hypothetical protein AK823_06325 [Psychrobacter sp. P2G3]AMN67388.1 hypothetical protein AK825_06395 [Psychrobacter sp. P11G5]
MMNSNEIAVMESSTFIGSSIFLYIVAFIAVMVLGGYLTYHTTAKRKRQLKDKRDRDNLN